MNGGAAGGHDHFGNAEPANWASPAFDAFGARNAEPVSNNNQNKKREVFLVQVLTSDIYSIPTDIDI